MSSMHALLRQSGGGGVSGGEDVVVLQQQQQQQNNNNGTLQQPTPPPQPTTTTVVTVLREQNRLLQHKLEVAERTIKEQNYTIQQLQQQIQVLQQQSGGGGGGGGGAGARPVVDVLPLPPVLTTSPTLMTTATTKTRHTKNAPSKEITFSPTINDRKIVAQQQPPPKLVNTPSELQSTAAKADAMLNSHHSPTLRNRKHQHQPQPPSGGNGNGGTLKSELSQSTAAKADAMLKSSYTTTTNTKTSSKHNQHPLRKDHDRQGSSEIFFDFRTTQQVQAQEGPPPPPLDGMPIIGNNNTDTDDDDDDEEDGPQLVMDDDDDDDDYHNNNNHHHHQEEQDDLLQNYDNNNNEQEQEQHDEEQHEEIGEIIVVKKFSSSLRKTSDITMGPEFDELRYDPLTPTRRPTPQPSSRVYHPFQQQQQQHNVGEDDGDKTSLSSSSQPQPFHRKNTPPPRPSTTPYDHLPSMVVTPVEDERSASVEWQQQQLQLQQFGGGGGGRSGEEQEDIVPQLEIMASDSGGIDVPSQHQQQQHHGRMDTPDMSSMNRKRSPSRQQQQQNHNSPFEIPPESLEAVHETNSEEGERIGVVMANSNNMPPLAPNNKYDHDDLPPRKIGGIQEAVKGLPRELSLAERTMSSSVQSTIGPTTSINSNTYQQHHHQNHHHQQQQQNNSTANDKKKPPPSKLPPSGGGRGGGGGGGNELSKTYEVTNLQIVDACGDRGLYTGSLCRKQRIPDGYGEIRYHKGGRTYAGDWRLGHWHGHGKLVNTTGDVYDGPFQQDHKDGPNGQLQFQDGRIFKGRFLQDQMREGILHFSDGSKYEGLLQGGKRNGFGRYDFADGSFYEGQWSNDQMDGRGQMEWMDGGWYQGDWELGVQHGRGVEVLPNGQVRHNGWWDKGHPSMTPIVATTTTTTQHTS